ncbi:ABC-2 type transport system ATP-binding protein [Clostridium tetanomorphum]|uniref:ABC transporter ATP-binding protein n=1 Tax=Clostridium tetanomorphum TaxID=1553 RepID=A0A923EBJ6_CLOTT|nr:ABC transporter ATP-binding protein [Clostridium tetanomorphum]KAJ51667.1 ABC transporter ATP-binding protein [Clostridium tetanomorphum DSM 665]KAJ51947.1 ABC transporter ATP-binding protein [Clostridium tetanomorphum DSM 665]MBC2398676.1 ABC transporter ATP-binding protein [Clostridium tetanomorphum]MBP1864044.1 ABC-2 type transport system ATP-binding protein [Clostridium tetanomorphum]NRS84456.1 ABC-2 type transport system ATP-binding protein [Clostridium tetanomorphum]
MENIIEVKNLEKSYKGKKAVKGISFCVGKGEVLGFLGPNGAGKSTTINILSTALGYDGGDIKFLGSKVDEDVIRVKRNIGVVPQDLAIYEDISTEKNVKFFASLYNLKGKELQHRVEEALKFVGLYEKRMDKPKTFSGGMKRRLNIACAILHNPKLIIMDEPTVGIDPQSRNHILNSIKELQKRGTTIIYTTHYMEEVEEIADRIIIMDNGQIIAEGTKEELKREIEDERIYSIDIANTEELKKEDFFKIEGVKDVVISEGTVKIKSLNTVENLDKLILTMMNKQCKIQNITSTLASLEMVFLNLTGKSLRD